jgi:hypothetical protein
MAWLYFITDSFGCEEITYMYALRNPPKNAQQSISQSTVNGWKLFASDTQKIISRPKKYCFQYSVREEEESELFRLSWRVIQGIFMKRFLSNGIEVENLKREMGIISTQQTKWKVEIFLSSFAILGCLRSLIIWHL